MRDIFKKVCKASTLLMGLVTVFLLCSPVKAQNWEEWEKGVIALQKGEYELAKNVLMPLAEDGYVLSILTVGAMYEEGLGWDQNSIEAYKWYSVGKSLSDVNGDETMLTLAKKVIAELSSKMTSDELAKANLLVMKFLKEKCKQAGGSMC